MTSLFIFIADFQIGMDNDVYGQSSNGSNIGTTIREGLMFKPQIGVSFSNHYLDGDFAEEFKIVSLLPSDENLIFYTIDINAYADIYTRTRVSLSYSWLFNQENVPNRNVLDFVTTRYIVTDFINISGSLVSLNVHFSAFDNENVFLNINAGMAGNYITVKEFKKFNVEDPFSRDFVRGELVTNKRRVSILNPQFGFRVGLKDAQNSYYLNYNAQIHKSKYLSVSSFQLGMMIPLFR